MYMNQTNKIIAKVGIHRVRAIELLKTLFKALNQMGKDGKQIVSLLLKTKVIETMLFMIKTFPFCCITH